MAETPKEVFEVKKVCRKFTIEHDISLLKSF